MTAPLAGLQTETRNPQTTAIDRVSTETLCRILHSQDARIPAAVEPCIPIIAQAIDTLAERLRAGGRVFYMGAGTSGRLGVLDASEIPPTYSAPPGQFVALIAGGDEALRHAKEGAEDSRSGAEADLEAHAFDPQVDSLVGIASSGRTPYVLGGLEYVRRAGGVTVGVVCVEPSAVASEGNAQYLVAAVTGPEAVTGSTRMKAGTATKLILNMMSTGIMVRLGKTYGNLMVDLRATNIKLQQRARNILRLIGGPRCTQSDEELGRILYECHGSVKLAAATIVLGVPVADAEARLRQHGGLLARVIEEHEGQQAAADEAQDDGLVLCVDAGGTSCKAVIMSRDGVSGCGAAGPCNVSSIGLDAAMASMSQAIQEAVDDCPVTKGRKFGHMTFQSVWIGIAGYERPALAQSLGDAVCGLVKTPPGTRPRITADTDLLSASMSVQQDIDSVIVLVSGTGSIGTSFRRAGLGFQRTGRVGGWGHLLGDDGSGYSIGREALRRALRETDVYRMTRDGETATASPAPSLSPLSRAIYRHFEHQYPASNPGDLLSAIVMPFSGLGAAENASLGTTKRIAGVAKTVLSMAAAGDDEAKSIVAGGTASLAELVTLLVRGQGMDVSRCGLVLAGGLMQSELYRDALLDAVRKQLGEFGQSATVKQPAFDGAELLAKGL
ncbi:N-acetylmuramic acid-6-phosphate etherase and BadF/BadG/BcrA/BcrD ATPase domain protein [Metarhizium robertsii]|uniref:N-acetyl-D-glucosamine kinase n=2 Tax=Metarhizium robertsii TaxID=568076 RepID=E9EXF8_METRA|nr:N-acetylmuramic acid 6-phosphate etherase [Metarhizium robertsii ARSEF 23]EFY99778.1 N-acetylmuramic acid 6-phosphate etherase [Metarhizium robertsii ARSEF 23]EXV06466.1 N-acetylmuramic acid-6-phosphate etherase and BadF/BadG/BcrA/BcrD ATPase domain protein [Metarhizium robertsii]